MSAVLSLAAPLMLLPRVVTFAVLVGVVLPGLASAGVRMESRDEPLVAARAVAGTERVLPARTAPSRFNLVGLHWRGTGKVSFRTESAGGGWSVWHAARPEGEDLPDAGTMEAEAARGWKIGNPYWTGPSFRIQYRLTGEVSRLRAFFLWSPAAGTPRTVAKATMPPVIRRSAWGADESIVRASPSYASRIAFAVVHHTAGASPSSPSESAAIVRGIQWYHVKGNGWNDIGYNFLVDRFGQVFEGRGGGITRNVIGAHAQGFNTGSVGVAVLGDYSSSGISTGARDALTAVLSWRLDLAHVDPESRLTWSSGGNARFPAGTAVRLAAVSGHRDTGYTSCPGGALYASLPDLRSLVAGRGLPKLYSPHVSGGLGGPVRFTAEVSPARDWSVTIRDAAGNVVASGGGTGVLVDWTWDSSGAPFAAYRYEIAAGAARPVRGRLGSAPVTPTPLELTTAASSRGIVTPNDDGVGDRTRLEVGLSIPAEARISVWNEAGERVANALNWQSLPAGTTRLSWAGRKLSGVPLPDGRYTLRFEARTDTEEDSASVPVLVDRTLGALTARPEAFSPNGDRRLDLVAFGFELAREAAVRVRVFAGRTVVTTLTDGSMGTGSRSVTWSGRAAGEPVADGVYRVVVTASTEFGVRTLGRRFRLDTVRPAVSSVSARRLRGGTLVRFTLGEPARVRIWIGTRSFAVDRDAGRRSLWRRVKAARIRIVAWDAAGNASLARRALVTL